MLSDGKLILLYLIGTTMKDVEHGELGGITRILNLTFILEKEYNIKSVQFIFRNTEHGPYAHKLIDFLFGLENYDYIKREIVGNAVEADRIALAKYYSKGADCNSSPQSGDAELDRVFTLTQTGKRRVTLSEQEFQKEIDIIRTVKEIYNPYCLNDLLDRVRDKYPRYFIGDKPCPPPGTKNHYAYWSKNE